MWTKPDDQLGSLPIAGADGKPVPAAYDVNNAIGYDCPTCGVAKGDWCINKITGKVRKIGCLDRTRPSKR